MRKILLLDGHTVQTISIARFLKYQGWNIAAFIDNKVSYGYFSRFIDKKIIAPKANSDNKEYLIFIEDYLSKENCDLIVPMYDDSASFLSKNKEYLEKRYNIHCAVPSYDVFIKGHDKHLLMDICRLHNIPHPKTMSLKNNNLSEVIDYIGFPLLIKPNISSGSRGILYIETFSELKEKINNLKVNIEEFTLQEYIKHTGIYYNVMLYRNARGEFSDAVIIKIKRYFPIKGGTSCYSETIVNEHLTNMCKQTLNALDWHGFADFDIMEDLEGNYKIIEINPRFPASIHASFISGVNFTDVLIRDLLLSQPLPVFDYKTGLTLRFFGLDVMWFLFSKDRFSFKPSWFKFFGKKIYYQDGSIKDPLPMLIGCMAGILKYLKPNYRKSKLS